MAITKLNSLAIPPNTIVESDLSYPLTNFSSTGIDDNATSTAVTINASENVGIGVVPDSFNTVDGALQVGTRNTITSFSNDIGIGYNHYYNSGWKYANTDVAARFSSTSAIAFLWQYAASGSADGSITWSEAMRIDSSGNFLVGTTNANPTSSVVNDPGVELSNTGGVRSTVASNAAATFNRKTDDGAVILFRKDGSTKGNIGINGGDEPYFARSVGTTSGIKIANGALTACQSDGTNDDNGQDLGSSSIRWRNFHMAGDAVMGSSSNIIYESGTTFNVRAAVANLTFQTSGANERMRIDSAGKVGVGITNPSGSFHVTTKDASGSDVYYVAQNTTSNRIAGYRILDESNNVGGVFQYDNGGNNLLIGTSTSSNFQFTTSNAERMRIDSSGNVLVGTTTTVGTGTEGIQLGTNGSIITGRNQTSDQIHHIFKNPNGTVGTIRTLNNATSYVTSSDQRLKENIVDAPAGNIDAIRIRSFDWKADGSHQTYGMVAQELVDVAPEAVSQGETEEDMWGVDYSKLVPMMIKEIQDLKAEVAALKGA